MANPVRAINLSVCSINARTAMICFRVGFVLALTFSTVAGTRADGTKVYKVIDANGNITYSQTPPMESPPSSKVDTVTIKPAYVGRGSWNPGESVSSSLIIRRNMTNSASISTQSRENAVAKHMADLKAECERNRGTDCDDPEALRYLDSTKVPHRGFQ